MIHVSTFRISIIFVLFFSFSLVGLSQEQQRPKVQNPNAASLGVFGEIPLGMYTGAPSINIPLYTLMYGKIAVPIALKYHPSSVKPAAMPGWVGLGWNLESYGRITRTMRNWLDEMYFPDQPGGGALAVDTYYPAPPPIYNPATGNNSGSEKVNVSNWDATTQLNNYYTLGSPAWPTNRDLIDVEADEFSFNVGNYSGKFYYSGPTLGWQVTSPDHIKVELTDFSTGNNFFTTGEVFNALDDYLLYGPSFPLIDNQGGQSRMFRGFVLTVPDGTKYYFGGADAVEFSCPYGTTFKTYLLDNWLLKKIVDVNGNEVVFEYRRSWPTVNLSFGQSDFYYSSTKTSGTSPCSSGSTWGNGTVNAKLHGGRLQWPMYLNKISCPTQSVEFLGSVATFLRYTDVQLTRIYELGSTSTENLFNLTLLGTNPYDPANVNNIKWEKLDWVVIKNSKQDILKQYNFYYQPTTSTGQRLTLNSVTELDGTTVLNAGTYSFFYNAVADLPMYFGDYTDHWGYYNNRTAHGAWLPTILASNIKETDNAYVNKGLLTSIKYPTGGSTVFTWEPHDYSAVVALNRTSLTPATGYAGGGRLSKIQTYSAEGALLTEKKYYYKKNYTAGVNPATLTSSGVLNGNPKYHLSISGRPATDGTPAAFTIDLISLNSLSTYSYNAQGSHIGYDEVVEVNRDGSYTKNFFTNYGTDMNGSSHYDRQAGFIGWLPTEDTYFPMSSLEAERGNPVGVFKYSSRNTLVQKKIITYRNDEARFNSFVKRIDFNHSYACNPGWGQLTFVSARKEYNYSYYPVKTEVTDYDIDGGNPITTVTTMSYNSYNMLSQQDETDSKGLKRTTLYKYPFDFPSNSTLTAMTNAHILTPVIETTTTLSNGGTTPLTLNRVNYYSPYTGIYVPSSIEAQKGYNPVEAVEQFNNYDSKGKLREVQKTNDIKEVYIWGYNGDYVVAKIENSDYATVSALITPSMQTTITNASLVYTDADVRTALNNIRTGLLSGKALVTTYTYAPGRGLTSETDPNGNTTYYEYDGVGRLQVIKDRNNNIVKTFDYHFKQ